MKIFGLNSKQFINLLNILIWYEGFIFNFDAIEYMPSYTLHIVQIYIIDIPWF